MSEVKRRNELAELLKSRDGFILIRDAVKLLGPEKYSLCLTDLSERPEEDPERADLFFQNGDYDKGGLPTHICFPSVFMERLSDRLSDTLEQKGVLTKKTKGVKVI